MTNIIMAIAIVVLTAAICVLTKKQKDIEEELDTFASSEVEVPELDNIEAMTVKANDEINSILARLDDIAKDIGRLDAETKEDRRNLADVRRRYILWREPVDKGSGVSWAKDYPCNEDMSDKENENE